MQTQLWVEPKEGFIAARLTGVFDTALLRECQARVLRLVRETGLEKILYDTLELELPHLHGSIPSRKTGSELSGYRLRRAIVVPNTRLAYVARLALGDGYYRVFYNDSDAAERWLTQLPLSMRFEHFRQPGHQRRMA